MGYYTENLNLYLPIPNEEGWGEKVNENFEIIDSTLQSFEQKIESDQIKLTEYIEDKITSLTIDDIAINSGINCNNKSITDVSSLSSSVYQWIAPGVTPDMFKRGSFNRSSTYIVPDDIHPDSSLTLRVRYGVAGNTQLGHGASINVTVTQNERSVFQSSVAGATTYREAIAVVGLNCKSGDIFAITCTTTGNSVTSIVTDVSVYAMKQVPVIQT